MDTDQLAPENRGIGGKLRKPPPRKPPVTPYARPPETARRRWISKLVEPAYNLFAGGASRILPSFFSTPAPASDPASATEDQGKWRIGEEHKDDLCKSDIHLLSSESTEVAKTGDLSGKMKYCSDFVLSTKDQKGEHSEKNRLSDIEQLVKGKHFSRDEFDRIVEVLNSRAMDFSNVDQGNGNTNLTLKRDDEGLAVAPGHPNVSNDQRHDGLNGAVLGSSTPLGRLKVQNEIVASPIEIARAYMVSRASGAGPSSKRTIQTVESTVLHGDEASIIPYEPSSSKKKSTCWPGAVVQDAYVTPQSERSRYGLHNFPRTPYSRTLITKSKSTLIHTQGDYGHNSSTPLHQSQTSQYLQDKWKVGTSEGGYGSVGPIRRIRHKVGVQSSLRRPAYSSHSASKRESFGVIEDSTPTVADTTDPDGTSSSRKSLGFEVGVPTVHMHTSLMAKKILEHIDRNIPTPLDKSVELKLATKWKNPESSTNNFSNILSSEDNGLLKFKDVSTDIFGGFDGEKHSLRNESKSNGSVDIQPGESTKKPIEVRNEGTIASDMNVCSRIPTLGNDARTIHSFGGSQNFSMNSTKEHASKTLPTVVNQEKNGFPNSASSKPALPPITIKKPESRWTLASDSSSGFTFPISKYYSSSSSSSSAFSEPPTPSIMPFSTGDDHQLKEKYTEPSFSFGVKKSSLALVFSFPSTSNTAVQNNAGDIKFNFGSTEKERLSFSFGKTAVSC